MFGRSESLTPRIKPAPENTHQERVLWIPARQVCALRLTGFRRSKGRKGELKQGEWASKNLKGYKDRGRGNRPKHSRLKSAVEAKRGIHAGEVCVLHILVGHDRRGGFEPEIGSITHKAAQYGQDGNSRQDGQQTTSRHLNAD
jgi:hypothetical protein